MKTKSVLKPTSYSENCKQSADSYFNRILSVKFSYTEKSLDKDSNLTVNLKNNNMKPVNAPKLPSNRCQISHSKKESLDSKFPRGNPLEIWNEKLSKFPKIKNGSFVIFEVEIKVQRKYFTTAKTNFKSIYVADLQSKVTGNSNMLLI
jgi:hypothetical protein